MQGGNTTPVNTPQTYDTTVFENAAVSQLRSDGLDELLVLANNTMKKWRIAALVFFASLSIGIACSPLLLFTLASFIYGIYVYTKGKVILDYCIDDEMNAEIFERMNPLVKISKSKKIWRKTQSSKVVDKKYQAGASNIIKREKCTASCKVPSCLKIVEVNNNYVKSFNVVKIKFQTYLK